MEHLPFLKSGPLQDSPSWQSLFDLRPPILVPGLERITVPANTSSCNLDHNIDGECISSCMQSRGMLFNYKKLCTQTQTLWFEFTNKRTDSNTLHFNEFFGIQTRIWTTYTLAAMTSKSKAQQSWVALLAPTICSKTSMMFSHMSKLEKHLSGSNK